MQAVHMQVPDLSFIPWGDKSMPVVWLFLGDQVIIISKDLFDGKSRNENLLFF